MNKLVQRFLVEGVYPLQYDSAKVYAELLKEYSPESIFCVKDVIGTTGITKTSVRKLLDEFRNKGLIHIKECEHDAGKFVADKYTFAKVEGTKSFDSPLEEAAAETDSYLRSISGGNLYDDALVSVVDTLADLKTTLMAEIKTLQGQIEFLQERFESLLSLDEPMVPKKVNPRGTKKCSK